MYTLPKLPLRCAPLYGSLGSVYIAGDGGVCWIMDMNWLHCSDLFHKDGSLRDLYVLGTTMKEWELFMSFLLASEYTLGYTSDGEISTVPEKAGVLFADREHAHNLTINVSGIIINCHCFTMEEIEMDIDPREVTSQVQLDVILGFMTEVGKVVQRDVLLTEESGPDYVLLKYSIDAGDVIRVETS